MTISIHYVLRVLFYISYAIIFSFYANSFDVGTITVSAILMGLSWGILRYSMLKGTILNKKCDPISIGVVLIGIIFFPIFLSLLIEREELRGT